MTKRMLIDASHPEETRLVVMDGNKVEDFDVEAADRLPLKGNIYLAKIVRVEPSLQAAFVEYGGNRHGFLAFGEIHPDYYQIPVADRQRILEMQAQEADYEDDDEAELDTAAERVAPSDDRDLDAAGADAGREGAGREGGGREAREGGKGRRGRGRGRDRNRVRAVAGEEGAGEGPGSGEGGDGAEESPNTAGRDPFGDETPPPGGQEPDAAGRDALEDDASGRPATPAGRDAFEGGAAGGDEEHEAGGAPREGAEPPPPAPRTAGRNPFAADDEAPSADETPNTAGRDPFGGETPPPGGQEPEAAGRDALDEEPGQAPDAAGRDAFEGGAAGGDATPPGGGAAPRQVFGDAPQDPDAAPRATPRARPMSMHGERVSEGDPVAPPPPLAEEEDAAAPETIGEGEGEERAGTPRIPPRFLRHYKIQDVIRRRQIILVQVVKEERGSKGAALTSFISLAGRFSVLMPNSPRGGGVSRKITQVADRKRLREAVQEMELPRGMSIIVRTAGAQRPKPEIRRDGEYLMRLWDEIRERTLASMAPALVYEEADLIKRALRDSFGRDIDDVEVEGEDAWRQARDFMRMIMPQHEKKIRLYRDQGVPLFAKAGAEAQLDGMMNPRVELPSGGTIVINQTEALVAIDVNSGRATRDRHIEDTALRTNCEAADEIGRQLRLRDLAGLIVVDFIDMESARNDAAVEKRLKDALRFDRARIQLGRISHFGLLEMSRQRLRPSVTEHSFATCAHCQGRGIVRSLESAALHVLRAIEEEGAKRRASEIVVHAPEAVALHLLNRKRERIASIEARHAMAVLLSPDAGLSEAEVRIERTRAQQAQVAALPARAPALRMDYAPEAPAPVGPAAAEAASRGEAAVGAEEGAVDRGVAGRDEGGRDEAGGPETSENGRRRRRRRRGGRREGGAPADASGEAGDAGEDEAGAAAPVRAVAPAAIAAEGGAVAGGTGSAGPAAAATPEAARQGAAAPGGAATQAEAEEARERRRGRRGGRRRAEELAARGVPAPAPREEEVPEAPRYAGPTPADPFGGTYDAVMEAIEAAEAAAEALTRVAARPAEPGPEPVGLRVAAPASTDPGAADPGVVGPGAADPEAADGTAPVAAPSATDAVPDPATDFLPAAEPAVAAEALPGAAPPAGEGGPVAGPAVRPVVLGEAPAEGAPRRRGWWSR